MTTNNTINLSSAGIVKYDGAGTFAADTTTTNAILYGTGSNGIGSLTLTNGQLAVGSTGATPVATTLSAGTGVSITNGAGSITINSTGGGLSWTQVTTPTQSLGANSGYTIVNSGTVTLTLPATIPQFSVIQIVGQGAGGTGGWTIAQNSGQQIVFGKSGTTVGAGGSLSSTYQTDCVYLLCTTANTDFQVLNSVGNLTVV